MNRQGLSAVMLLLAAGLASAGPVEKRLVSRESVERGAYLARIAGCHDCHTPGWTTGPDKVPRERWLTGDALGWQGPWGTTYAANLRLYMQKLSEAQWLEQVRKGGARPPMPWQSLRDMSDRDLRAIYRYVLHLGVAGKPAPAWLPPGQKASGPVVVFPPAP